MIKRYLKYLRDNPDELWFRRKQYGWGWVPVRWQGWVAVILFVIYLTRNGLAISSEPTTGDVVVFYIQIVLSATILIIVCYKTGEKPRWQWGLPKIK